MKSEVIGDLQKFKDELAKEVFGEDTKENRKKGLCIQCKEPALKRCYSEAGRKEYHISGLCELCFDDICKEGGED